MSGTYSYSIKDWGKFQHFKDRKPLWIKLYRDILDDHEWFNISGDDAKILVMLWLIASEYDGNLPNMQKLSFRMRMGEKDLHDAIVRLSHWVYQVDNSRISSCYQVDSAEQEKSREETEKRQRRVDGARDPLPVPDPPSILDKSYHAAFTKEATRLRKKLPNASEKKISDMAMDDLKKRGMAAAKARPKSKPEAIASNVQDITKRLEKAATERGSA